LFITKFPSEESARVKQSVKGFDFNKVLYIYNRNHTWNGCHRLGSTMLYSAYTIHLFICQGTSTRRQRRPFSVIESSCHLLQPI